jgi:hypothetical protein
MQPISYPTHNEIKVLALIRPERYADARSDVGNGESAKQPCRSSNGS